MIGADKARAYAAGRRRWPRRIFQLSGLGDSVSACATVLGVVVIGWATFKFFEWGILGATWYADSAAKCEAGGACWAVIAARYRLILFGLYPYDEQWRSATACAVVVAMIASTCIPALWKVARLAFVWIVGSAAFGLLMGGGAFGLTPVSTEKWGGLALTLFMYTAAMAIGFPLAIVLALMRRSDVRAVSIPAGALIDALRTFPLVTVLFTAGVIAPFALPPWLFTDKVYRIVTAFVLVFACYEAETVRAGLQAIPPEQDEAARALGMGYWLRVCFVLLPQGLKNTLPSTVNQFVVTLKETSVVSVVGLFDFTASAQAAYSGAEWANAYIEVYVFIGLIYFTCTFILSTYGGYLEHRTSAGG